MPLVKQKSQLNDNLSLTFYFGQNGIPIFPSCRCGSDSLEDEYLNAFPKNSIVALGISGFNKYSYQKTEWRRWIEKIIDTINPKCLITIGSLSNTLINTFKNKVEIISYDSFMEKRFKEINLYVN